LLLRQGDAEAAEELYGKALSIAREQEAKLWELRAAASLARLWRDRGRRAAAATCSPRSTAGSPRVSPPPISRKQRRCSTSCNERGVRRQRLRRFVSPEDELPADGTKPPGRVGAWLKQRARKKPAGKSFFCECAAQALAPLISFVRRTALYSLRPHSYRQPQPPQGFLIGSQPVWALRPAYTLNVEEVAGLDPNLAALRTGLCLEGAAGREPQPGLRLEALNTLVEIAVQCQDLRTSR